jgi:hypothetical protein
VASGSQSSRAGRRDAYPVGTVSALWAVRYTSPMKRTHLALGVFLCLGLAGCEPPPPSQCQEDGFYDLVFAGEGFNSRVGDMVPFRLARATDGWVEQSGAAIIGEDGAFEERVSCGLEAAVSYDLSWYVREELGADCDDSNKAWVEAISPPNQDVEVVASPDLQADPEGCAPF